MRLLVPVQLELAGCLEAAEGARQHSSIYVAGVDVPRHPGCAGTGEEAQSAFVHRAPVIVGTCRPRYI